MLLPRVPWRCRKLYSGPLENTRAQVRFCYYIRARCVRCVQADWYPGPGYTSFSGYQDEEREVSCQGGFTRCWTRSPGSVWSRFMFGSIESQVQVQVQVQVQAQVQVQVQVLNLFYISRKFWPRMTTDMTPRIHVFLPPWRRNRWENYRRNSPLH